MKLEGPWSAPGQAGRRLLLALIAGWILGEAYCTPALALALSAESTQMREPCSSDTERNQWLTACGWAISEQRWVARREPEGARDPWSILQSTDEVFTAEDHLAKRFVQTCFGLLAPPSTTPEASQKALSEFRSLAEAKSCRAAALQAWLSKCVEDAEALVPSASRRELLALFKTEGGISHPCARRFLHRRCEMLKVKVSFRCVEGDRDMEEEMEDEVETVTPYIGFFFAG